MFPSPSINLTWLCLALQQLQAAPLSLWAQMSWTRDVSPHPWLSWRSYVSPCPRMSWTRDVSPRPWLSCTRDVSPRPWLSWRNYVSPCPWMSWTRDVSPRPWLSWRSDVSLRPPQMPFVLKWQKAVPSRKAIAVVPFPAGLRPSLLLEQTEELWFLHEQTL